MNKFILIITMLLSTLLIGGCGTQNFTGTWIGFNDKDVMYKLSIQENGNSYLVTRTSYTYKPEKGFPEVKVVWQSRMSEAPRKTTFLDIPFILTKKQVSWNTTLSLNETKDQLLTAKEMGYNIYIVAKDKSLLYDGIRYTKENDSNISNEILEKMQTYEKQSLTRRYYRYGERSLDDSTDIYLLGNITFNNSALSEN